MKKCQIKWGKNGRGGPLEEKREKGRDSFAWHNRFDRKQGPIA